MTGIDGDVEWNTSEPDCQPRGRPAARCAEERFGWTASIPFRECQHWTIEWYETNRDLLQE